MPAILLGLASGAAASPQKGAATWAEIQKRSTADLQAPLAGLFAGSLKLVRVRLQHPPAFQRAAFADFFSGASFNETTGLCAVRHVSAVFVPDVEADLVNGEMIYLSDPDAAPLKLGSATYKARYKILGQPLQLSSQEGKSSCQQLANPEQMFDADDEESATRAAVLLSWIKQARRAGTFKWTCNMSEARCRGLIAKLDSAHLAEVTGCSPAAPDQSCTRLHIVEDKATQQEFYSVVTISGPTMDADIGSYSIKASGRVRVID